MARKIQVSDLARSSAARAREAFHSIDSLVRDPKPALSAGASGMADLMRILRAAFQRYLRDDCVVRANAIAYSIVIAIIPLLTLLVRFATVEREDLSRNLARFLSAYGLSDASQLLAVLDEILSRSYTITGVGVLFMIYSAASLLQHVETSFNFIYRARKQRPILIRFSLYIASFTLLPALGVAVWSGMRSLFNEIRPPEYSDVLSLNGQRLVAISTGEIRIVDLAKKSSIDLRQRVDSRAPMRDIYVDLQKLSAGPAWRTLEEAPAGAGQLTGADFYNLRRIAGRDDSIYAISEGGVLFFSYDRGRTWNFERLHTAGERVTPLELIDLRIDTSGRLQLLTHVESTTALLTRDHREREIPLWAVRKFAHGYMHMTTLSPAAAPLSEVGVDAVDTAEAGDGERERVDGPAATRPAAIALLGRGRYLISYDDGQSWSPPIEALNQGIPVELTAAARSLEGEMWFAARNGAFWIQSAEGPIGPDLDLDFGQYVETIQLREDGVALVAGPGGLLRITQNRGRGWQRFEPSWLESVHLIAAEPLEDGAWLLAGEEGALARLSNLENSARLDDRGLPLISAQLQTIVRASQLGSVIIQGGVYVLLFFGLLLAFSAIYMFFPNTTVEWRAATAGAAITATALLLFVILFRLWAANFTAAAYIYGVWAALPLGMIVILASMQIVLFGLQVSYVVQHPYLYRARTPAQESENESDSLLWNSALLIALVYHTLYRRKKPLTDEMALYFFERKHLQLDYARNRLLDAGLIAYEPANGEYFPVKPPGEITIASLQSALFADMFQLPAFALDSNLRRKLAGLHLRLSRILAEEGGKLSVAELLPLLDKAESMGDLQHGPSV